MRHRSDTRPTVSQVRLEFNEEGGPRYGTVLGRWDPVFKSDEGTHAALKSILSVLLADLEDDDDV